MADPFTIGIMALSAGISAMGAISQGNAAAASANSNAQLAREQRLQEIKTAQIASEDKSRENRRQLSAMRASVGSSGVELAGSPLDVLNDTSIEMALDSRRVEYEGEVRGRESAIRANNYIAEGKNARNASRVSAFSSLLGGANSIAKYNNMGA